MRTTLAAVACSLGHDDTVTVDPTLAIENVRYLTSGSTTDVPLNVTQKQSAKGRFVLTFANHHGDDPVGVHAIGNFTVHQLEACTVAARPNAAAVLEFVRGALGRKLAAELAPLI